MPPRCWLAQSDGAHGGLTSPPSMIPTSIQLTGFAIEVDPSPIWNWPHVRFGSKADICSAKRHAALPPKADIGCCLSRSRTIKIGVGYAPSTRKASQSDRAAKTSVRGHEAGYCRELSGFREYRR